MALKFDYLSIIFGGYFNADISDQFALTTALCTMQK